MYKPCQRPSYRHVPPPLTSRPYPLLSQIARTPANRAAAPPLSPLSLAHPQGRKSRRRRPLTPTAVRRRPAAIAPPRIRKFRGGRTGVWIAVQPPRRAPPPARGALLQPENTVAPEKVPLWHCSRSARWYAFRVFFFFWGGGKKVEAKIQFTLDNHAVEWVLISSSCYSVRNLLMFVQFLELISWYSLQLMNASLFLELIS